MGSLSLAHILILVIIFIIFFKPKRLSELGGAIGKTIKNFKQSKNEIEVEAEVISEEKKKL